MHVELLRRLLGAELPWAGREYAMQYRQQHNHKPVVDPAMAYDAFAVPRIAHPASRLQRLHHHCARTGTLTPARLPCPSPPHPCAATPPLCCKSSIPVAIIPHARTRYPTHPPPHLWQRAAAVARHHEGPLLPEAADRRRKEPQRGSALRRCQRRLPASAAFAAGPCWRTGGASAGRATRRGDASGAHATAGAGAAGACAVGWLRLRLRLGIGLRPKVRLWLRLRLRLGVGGHGNAVQHHILCGTPRGVAGQGEPGSQGLEVGCVRLGRV